MSLTDDIEELKTALARHGHPEFVAEIDEARSAGSTSLEIHFRLLGVLRHIRNHPTLPGTPDVRERANALIAAIEERVSA